LLVDEPSHQRSGLQQGVCIIVCHCFEGPTTVEWPNKLFHYLWPQIMSDTDPLRDAIESLYVVFSQYRLRERIDACSHCHGSHDDRLLRSKTLRELGVQELHHYTWDALTTWGDDYDFRHFLPRILEIYALDESLTDQFIEPEIVLGKLEYARWSNWPPREQEAVRQYLTALWLSKINHDFPWEDFSVSSIEYWLCAIGQAEDDLEPYLTAWEAASSPAAVGNLSHWIVSVHDELAEKKLCSAFWKNRQVQCAQVVNWVLGKKIREKLVANSTRGLPSEVWTKRALESLKLLT
jgi:hypothetical protein